MKVPKPHHQRSLTAAFVGLLAMSFASTLTSCKKTSDSDSSKAPGLPSVRITQPVTKSLNDIIEATGTFSSSQEVSLIARVQGELQNIDFEDGAWVKKGQTLFRIDPTSYTEQVNLYQAQLTDAEAEYQRQLIMVKQNATSVAKVETWLSRRDQAKAQVELAKINLGYTTVVAPFDGRIGRRYVDAGNVVGPGMPSGDKLVDIKAIDPIYIEFDLSERDLLRIRKAFGDDHWPQEFAGKVGVDVALSDDEGFPHKGSIDFVDTSLSTSTGTISLRAKLANPDGMLIPGLFAKIRVPVGEPTPKLLVPQRCLSNDQQGDFVMTVNAKNHLARLPVTKGSLYDGMRAVSGGISTDTRVVVGGQVNARAGVEVTIASSPEAPE